MAVDNTEKRDALRLTPVSRETEARLDRLVAELLRWQNAKNLVSDATLGEVWHRHIADSLQLLDAMPHARRWLDLGSGGGFPGLVIAIRLAETGGQITLVESNARKCAFLRHAARVTGSPASIHHGRIEEYLGRHQGLVDVVTARALAPLSTLLGWTHGLLRTGTVGLFPKGQHLVEELTEASKYWTIHASQIASVTDPAARILKVTGAEQRVDS